MKEIAYCVYRENDDYVAQCLNVDVSSFGSTRAEAVTNLKEALELYFEDQPSADFIPVRDVSIGEELIHA